MALVALSGFLKKPFFLLNQDTNSKLAVNEQRESSKTFVDLDS